TALDGNIGGYAHESGRSVIIVVNKWDLVTHPATNSPLTNSNPNTNHPAPPGPPRARPPDPATNPGGPSTKSGGPSFAASGEGWVAPKVDQKIYEQQVRDKLKYLDYAPLVFISAASGKGIE